MVKTPFVAVAVLQGLYWISFARLAGRCGRSLSRGSGCTLLQASNPKTCGEEFNSGSHDCPWQASICFTRKSAFSRLSGWFSQPASGRAPRFALSCRPSWEPLPKGGIQDVYPYAESYAHPFIWPYNPESSGKNAWSATSKRANTRGPKGPHKDPTKHDFRSPPLVWGRTRM